MLLCLLYTQPNVINVGFLVEQTLANGLNVELNQYIKTNPTNTQKSISLVTRCSNRFQVYYLSEVVVIYLFPEKLMMGPKEMSAFKSVLISHIYNWIFAFKITQFSYDLPSKLTQLKTQPHHSTNFLSVDVSVYISLSMCKCSRFTISKQQTRLSLLLLLLFNKKCTVRMDIYVCLRILRKYMDFMAQRKRIKIEICALLISKPLFSFWFETW